jgi:hypothetical protein
VRPTRKRPEREKPSLPALTPCPPAGGLRRAAAYAEPWWPKPPRCQRCQRTNGTNWAHVAADWLCWTCYHNTP